MISEVVSVPNLSDIMVGQKISEFRSHPLREFHIGPENASLLEVFEFRNSKADERNLKVNSNHPILLHGPTAVGKSHLLSNLSEIASNDGTTILTDATAFSTEFSNATQLGNTDGLRRRFKRASLVLFDDVDQLETRSFSQQQLSQILDARIENQLPTVLTARHVPLRTKLSAFLASRISSGVVLPLNSPSATTFRFIIRDLSDQMDLNLATDAAQFLANSCESVHDLRQVLTVIQTKKSATKCESVSLTELKKYIDDQTRIDVDPKVVIRAIAKAYGLRVLDLTGQSRRKQCSTARGMAMLIIRKSTQLSFAEIGRYFGQRDHTTVMHACRKIEGQRKADPIINEMIQKIGEKLQVSIK